ncbi:MAG TPA: histidine phosphatase family protein [Terrimesophilobacter sp.]|uniref:histidine phosphatase family protein n=1 Tax=Terrimesophilobacter sp. TaxID=2906435 RepID=UPI002F957202
MPASQIHLVRHGEVHNPDGILYGRIPGYHLSELGHRMAAAAAASVKDRGRPVSRLISSPLQRAQESAQPFSELFGLPIETDDRLIEPTNKFEGRTFEFGPQVLTRPQAWPWVVNPFRPSWGEAYRSIADRMLAAIDDAWAHTESGDVVLVSHQLPIWTVARELAGERLFHDPRKRRCHLSSITTLERTGNRFVEVSYQDPAAELLAQAVDNGAV